MEHTTFHISYVKNAAAAKLCHHLVRINPDNPMIIDDDVNITIL